MKRILLTPPRLKKSFDRLLAGVLAFSMLLAPLPALAAAPTLCPTRPH